MNDIADLLNSLHGQRTVLDAIAETKAVAIKAAIPPEVAAAVDKINAEYEDYANDCREHISRLESVIKAAVLQHGATVKADNMMAVYVGGRVSWDDKALNGYMVDHPELARFRNIGKPSVTIRGAS